MTVGELLSQLGIPYKEKGKDYLVLCLNPDHEDSSPSLYIDKELGMYHCYSCGFKGKSIYEHLGVEVPRVSPQIQSFKRKLQELSIFSVGVTIPDSIEPFSGEFRDIGQETYTQLGAFTHSDWLGRICFPIHDLVTGNICAVVQRTMYSDVKPKYLVYPEGVKVPFYPARQHNGITVLVEGIFDVANLQDKGLDYATQLFGASTVTHNTVDYKSLPLIAADTKKIVILLDNDEAGNTSAKTLSKILSKHFRVHVQNSILPEGTDPGNMGKEEVAYLKRYIDEINWL